MLSSDIVLDALGCILIGLSVQLQWYTLIK